LLQRFEKFCINAESIIFLIFMPGTKEQTNKAELKALQSDLQALGTLETAKALKEAGFTAKAAEAAEVAKTFARISVQEENKATPRRSINPKEATQLAAEQVKQHGICAA
jgi:hypothetical protein